MADKATVCTLLLGLVAWVGLSQAAGAQAGEAASARHPAQPSARRLSARAYSPPAANLPVQRSKPGSRLGGELQRLHQQATSPAARANAVGRPALPARFPQLSFSPDGSSVLVRITAQDVNALLPSLLSRGFVVVASYPDLHFVEGMLPVSQLSDDGKGVAGLASRGLLGVLPARKPRARGGRVTSQADYALEAARTRATPPRHLTGSGVRVGVMSDSFDALHGAAADVAAGDLPAAGVQVLQDLTAKDGGTDEGRAMCQLINDLAPGAPLAFSSVYYGEGDFARQIINLADPSKGNCQILTDDIAYFGEPFFQDGVIAQAINQVVVQRGVAYFSAAGNEGDQSYENNAPRFVQATIGTQAAARLNFDGSGTTTDVTQRVTLANGQEFYPVLEWSDPFYTSNGVKTDLDTYLIAVNNGVAADTVAFSDDNNLLNQSPVENSLDYTNDSQASGTTTFDFVIVRRAGPTPARLKYVDYGTIDYNGRSAPEWLTHSPTLVGHPAAAGAQAVAAVDYADQRVAEYYTSKGGAIPILFGPTGTPLGTVETRQKPDIASIDGTDTSFFGGDELTLTDSEGNGFPNFYGTSAAAPHAAAAAALLRQAEPGLTPAQVYARLVGSARLLGTSATDPLTGPGLLDAFMAIYGQPTAATPPFVEDLEQGALSASWRVSSTAAGRVQVLPTPTPASGTYQLVLDAPYVGFNNGGSLNEAVWYVQGVGGNSLQLTFSERKLAGETDEVMPVSFTGTSNSDGVALSVDGGTTWYRVVDLTGTNATTTYQTKAVDLTAFAAANGLTLGTDVRLKFQQYGAAGASGTVAAQRGRLFDDITIVATPNSVDLEVWPNPVPRGTSLNLRLPPYAGEASLRLLDALGRVVWQEQVQQTGAALGHTLPLPPVAPGFYILQYRPAGGRATARHLAIE